MYKVPYSHPPGEGEFFKSVWEEYQVVKRGRKYHGSGEEYNVEKRERGSNIILLYNIEEYQAGKRERGRNFEEENQDLKCGGEEYQVVGNFIHPCSLVKEFMERGCRDVTEYEPVSL